MKLLLSREVCGNLTCAGKLAARIQPRWQLHRHSSIKWHCRHAWKQAPAVHVLAEARQPGPALQQQHQQQQEDEHFMLAALAQAEQAAAAGDVPVGAVLVADGRVIAAAMNETEALHDPTAHAEMLCIRQAAQQRNAWRLISTTLYVTLEPCPMCAGALLQARVGRLVYGARNQLLGADGSWISMLRASELNNGKAASGASQPWRPHPFHPDIQVQGGVLADASSRLLQQFFRRRRRHANRLPEQALAAGAS